MLIFLSFNNHLVLDNEQANLMAEEVSSVDKASEVQGANINSA